MNNVASSSVYSPKISLQPDDNAIFYSNFTENEMVKGKVIKSFSSNNILLLIKGKRIMAKTHMPLSQNSIISLKVEKIRPNPVLKLLGIFNENTDTINTSMILTGLKTNLWKSVLENIDRCMLPDNDATLFKALMDDISKKLFMEPNPDTLRELIDKSGMGWEAKLKEIITLNPSHRNMDINELISGDLKGLGSKFMSLMEGKNDLFEKFVSTIKHIQLLNHFGLEQERKLFIPIPFQFPDGLFTTGQLLIHFGKNRDKNGGGKEKGKEFFRISFLLEMSSLGPLRADVVVKQKQINGRFLIVEEKVKMIIEKQLPSLIKTLEDKGFYIPDFQCHIKESEKIKEPLIREIVHEERHNISLVA